MSGLTRDDIIRIYMQVSDELCGGTEWCWAGVGKPLQRFAALVAAAERDACAKLCDELANDAAKEQDFHALFACESCGSAIRERGQE